MWNCGPGVSEGIPIPPCSWGTWWSSDGFGGVFPPFYTGPCVPWRHGTWVIMVNKSISNGLMTIPFYRKTTYVSTMARISSCWLLVIYSMSVISSTIPLNPQCLMLNLSYPLSLLSIRIYHLYPITFPWMSLSNNTTYILTMANRSLNIPLNSHFNMLTFHDVPLW